MHAASQSPSALIRHDVVMHDSSDIKLCSALLFHVRFLSYIACMCCMARSAMRV